MPKIPKRNGWIEEENGYIPLSKGQVAVVDIEDLPILEKHNWCAAWSERLQAFYARTNIKEDDVWRGVLMHRFILGLKHGDGIQGDHRDGNTLDNRKKNLRKATKSQNGMNKGTQRNNKSGLKGVTWHARTGMWRADIGANGIAKTLGYFPFKEEAHEAYCAAAKIMHGEFFRTEPVERSGGGIE